METRATWNETLEPVIRKWMDDSYPQYADMVGKVFNVESSSRAYEEYMDSTGVGKLVAVGEGEPTPFEDLVTRVLIKPFLINGENLTA